MKIEVDDDCVDKLIEGALYSNYIVIASGAMRFDDKKEEKKLLKALHRVHDWYSAQPLERKLERENINPA
jgi:hypothetical protein